MPNKITRALARLRPRRVNEGGEGLAMQAGATGGRLQRDGPTPVELAISWAEGLRKSRARRGLTVADLHGDDPVVAAVYVAPTRADPEFLVVSFDIRVGWADCPDARGALRLTVDGTDRRFGIAEWHASRFPGMRRAIECNLPLDDATREAIRTAAKADAPVKADLSLVVIVPDGADEDKSFDCRFDGEAVDYRPAAR